MSTTNSLLSLETPVWIVPTEQAGTPAVPPGRPARRKATIQGYSASENEPTKLGDLKKSKATVILSGPFS